MGVDNDKVISTLNNLIETCKDGQNGFQTAADGVKRSELKTLFHTYSQQRAQFAGELQNEVLRLGGDPEKSGSTVAALHRGWIDIKSAVTGEDEGAIISECERGEDSAVSNYKDALEEDLPGDIRSIVE
ncbi:MAG TPA: PA2169 family four-helix-bundle protein, partial [Pyrinomonadaceae bacterium]|nr:PA2169 family four-helix-bundle protein [Pyrinomonadaceae bacterium]